MLTLGRYQSTVNPRDGYPRVGSYTYLGYGYIGDYRSQVS